MSLYENIHKRRKSGKPMRKKGQKGKYCVQAALTMAQMKKDILEQGV